MRLAVALFALVFALAPASAADDVAAAQSVIRAQEQAFGKDDAAAAYSYASPTIKEFFPGADIFMSMVENKLRPGLSPQEFRNSAKAAPPTARSRSASTSSTPMARPRKRSIRSSDRATAA